MAQNENAVMYAVEQVCGLYGVHYTREQSRMFNVQGAAGRWRPMFFGQWTDNFGKIHRRGKADFLLRPRVRFDSAQTYITVPLWVECKDIGKRLTPDQEAFRHWVTSNGDYHMVVEQDVRPLIAWLDEHRVSKNVVTQDAIRSVTNPIDASDVNALPCRHCGEAKAVHIGPYHGCRGKRQTVWSPDLKKGKRQ